MDFSLDYELLDSGDGKKLERYGEMILSRPSSVAVWERKTDLWKKADAEYVIKAGRPEGWKFRGRSFETWEMPSSIALSFRLRLQKNGQIGIFPEHSTYLGQVGRSLHALQSKKITPRVLNLFAYTGMASMFCAKNGAEVAHIDKSKAVLSWARENLELNSIKGVRLIPEDALTFLQREKKRGNTYHIVIADPVNFSRTSTGGSWDLDQAVIELVRAIADVMTKDAVLFLTCHQSYGFAETVNNILIDYEKLKKSSLNQMPLNIMEYSTKRQLPAGQLLYGSID